MALLDHIRIEHGDCLEVLPRLAAEGVRVDAIVTDPPYGLEFMGKDWDGADGFRRSLNKADTGRDSVVGRTSKRGPEYRTTALFQEWCETWANACLALLPPGGHLIAFGGTRTYHRLACAIEDAGFEIRDQIGWAYGSGFPKSHNVAKAIDKAQGAEPVTVAEGPTVRRIRPGADQHKDGSWEKLEDRTYTHRETRAATAAAEPWQGWGTALKPAWEPICLARKPLIGTVAENVLAHGTGAMNIDGCRVPTDEVAEIGSPSWGGPMKRLSAAPGQEGKLVQRIPPGNIGRWPANLVHDGSDDVEAAFAVFGDRASGAFDGNRKSGKFGGIYGDFAGAKSEQPYGANSGSASRFFFSAKADADDRCDSKHPTIKPVALMRWLVRLVTPPGGLVLDPFAGSGTTAIACLREGFDCILIEREERYVADIRHRLDKLQGLDTPLFGGQS